jgi:hypothetical protein
MTKKDFAALTQSDLRMQAYVHGSETTANGAKNSLYTVEVPVKEKLLPWQRAGRQYTRSGYGSRIPTGYMVHFNDRWRRVYCVIWSNSGTLYIGKLGGSTRQIIQLCPL